MSKILTHYWGSYFKSARHAANMEVEFAALTERGWDCHLVLEREPEDPEWIHGLRKLGVVITCLPRPRGNFDFQNITAIRHLCRKTCCTVFRCDNMHMSPLFGASLARVPVKIWCKQAMNSHYEQCREPGWRERLALTTRLSAYLSTRVIAVSSAVGAEVCEVSSSPDKVVVLNNPRPEIGKSNASREETRRQLGYSTDNVVFVNLGRAEKVKGWDILLKAFAKLSHVAPHARLLLVGAKDVRGDASFMGELDKLVNVLDLADRVCFTGHVTDVKALLQAGDVFVLPSRSEGCCLALLEALELSLPCVATRVGNATEVIQSGGAGILVRREHPEELAEALLLLATDEPKRAEMASQARIPDHVPSRRRYAQIVAELYESLLPENRNSGLPHELHPAVKD